MGLSGPIMDKNLNFWWCVYIQSKKITAQSDINF